MNQRKSIRYFIILIIITLFLFFLDRAGVISGIRGMGNDLLKSPREKVYSIWQSISNEFRVWTFWRSGQRKLQSLEERNRDLQAQVIRVSALEEENKKLREQIGVDFNIAHKYIIAQVIGYKGDIILNKGFFDGVKKDMIVVSGKYLVGKVAEVTQGTAIVNIPSSTDSRIEVITSGTSAKGIIKGQADGSIILDSVLQQETINLNDIILTSGGVGLYHEGLIIGKITKILTKPSDVFQKATIEPFLKYGLLTSVFIIKD